MLKENSSSFTGFQWALIEFLQTISSEFIFSKIVPKWQKKIRADNLFARNILVGFLNVYEMLDPETKWESKVKRRIESIFLNSFPDSNNILLDIQDKVLNGEIDSAIEHKSYKKLLNKLLKKECHLLFNSYFYTLEEIYGHERLLFSKIGYDPTDNNAIENFNSNLDYFDRQKLPFRVYNSKEFALTYANQLLPISAGVTPHFLQRAIQLAEENNPKCLFNVNFFLESLSLLHKREDFIQGHNSALIYVLRKEDLFNKCTDNKHFLGSLILTCIIPGILEGEPEKDLLNIIEKKYYQPTSKPNTQELQYPNKLGNITDQYKPLSFTLDKFKVHHPLIASYKSSLITRNAIADLNTIVDENFNTILASKPDNNQIFLQLSYKYALEGSICESKHHAINIEAMYHLARMLFPTETTVDYNLISGANYNKEAVFNKIDYTELKTYNDLVNKIFSTDPNQKFTINNDDLLSKKLFCQFFYCIFPEKDGHENNLLNHIHTEKITLKDNRNEPYRVVLFVEDQNDPKFKKTVSKLKKAIIISLNESINLPDGENPVFLALEKNWIESHKRNEKDQARSSINEKMNPLFILIKELTTKGGVRGIFILRERNYYIPELGNISDKDFIDCVQTYPSFWLFERLSSYLGTGAHLYNFEALREGGKSSLGKCMSFVYKYRPGKSNNVVVTYNPKNVEQNQSINRILLFLGIHITELKFDQSEGFWHPTLQIDNGEYYEDIRLFYKAYLRGRIKEVILLESSILASIFKPYTIKSIDWDESDTKKINIKFLLSKNGKETLYEIPWEINKSCEIEMAILDINKISSCFAMQQSKNYRSNPFTNHSFSAKEKPEVKQILSYSGKQVARADTKGIVTKQNLKSLNSFNIYINNLQNERNEIDTKMLLEVNELFLHRINRVNQYLANYLSKIDTEINKYYFKLGFFKVKEAQRQLYAISPRMKPKQFNDATFNFNGNVRFESILLFFYIKNIGPEKVYTRLFKNVTDFKSDFYDPLSELIEISQVDDQDDDQYDKKKFATIFEKINQHNYVFLNLYNKISSFKQMSNNEKLPHHIEYPKDKLFNIPNNRTKYFWIYFSCILDEIMDNSFTNSTKLIFSFIENNMIIQSLVKKDPSDKFIEKYQRKYFVSVTQPINEEYKERTSFGIYGLKLACDALGWSFSIRYELNQKIIIHKINFGKTNPFS